MYVIERVDPASDAFAYLRELTVRRGMSGLEHMLSLVNSLDHPSRTETVTCLDVRTLKLGDLVPGLLLCLELQDVKHEQHEGIRYRLVDVENGLIDLRCGACSREVATPA